MMLFDQDFVTHWKSKMLIYRFSVSHQLMFARYAFLDASSHLYKRPCPSVGPLVGKSIGRFIRNALVKLGEKWFTHCLESFKMQQGGRSDEESEEMKKKMKYEKVA